MGHRLIYVFLFCASGFAIAQPNYPKAASEATLVSTDIKNFISAYNKLNGSTDSLEVLQQYIDNGTPGLKEYCARFNLTAESLKHAIQKFPGEYAKIESFYKTTISLEADYRQELIHYKKVIPGAMFPPTYLLVADYKGIGQASKFGQLVSIEKINVDHPEKLKNMIIHELTHFQQALAIGIDRYSGVYSKKDNMLDLILREGAAEFITYKLVRQNEEQFTKLKNYQKDEVVLWKRFEVDLKNQDKDFWLNVSYDDNNKGNPIQMGYGLGYKIVEAYYNQEADKTKALQEILSIEDADQFLAKSGYAPK